MRSFRQLWLAVEQLPGPLWLVGAYGCLRLFRWIEAWLLQGIAYAGQGTLWRIVLWPEAALRMGGLLGAALPLWLFGGLAMRCTYALPLIKWYAGLKCVCHFISLFAPLFSDVSDPASALRMAWMNATGCVVWFGLLRYMEKPAVASLFPATGERRHVWAVLPMAAVILFFG